MKLRFWFPLAAYVVHTLGIGYGLVIPRSCIAGFNGLTIGFFATVATFAIAYGVGLHMALGTIRTGGVRNAEIGQGKAGEHRLTLDCFIPLAAFVVVNLGIGFVFAIPGTCIASVNEVTIGFVMAVVTGALTCWVGMLDVLRDERRFHEREFAAQHPGYKPLVLKPRYFIPVTGYVLLTAGIGFGLVIPGSCIAGINALTIGYLAAVVAAGLVCWAGMAGVARDVNQLRMSTYAAAVEEHTTYAMRPKYWGPMIGYQVFNLIIGFGVTIPGSCIAGVNLLTAGFLAALMLAVFVYWIGLTAVLRNTRFERRIDLAA